MDSVWMPRLAQLYRTYIGTVEELERNRPIGAGLFGLTPGPADDPCHDRFVAELDGLLREFSETSPGSAEAAEALRFLLEAPSLHREPKSLYWMLIAAQGLAAGLVGFLTQEDAAALAKSYGAQYPRRDRLPAQRELLKKLEKQAR